MTINAKCKMIENLKRVPPKSGVALVLVIRIWDFEFVSDFEFRDSDFAILENGPYERNNPR